jgi:hypothetical protein
LNYLDITVPVGKKVTLHVELKQKSKTQSQ